MATENITETAPTFEHDRTISKERFDLAFEATYEISTIVDVLRDHIERYDTGGEIKALARGMLGRVQRLSDAAAECIGHGDDWNDQQLRDIVTLGEPPRDVEASHD